VDEVVALKIVVASGEGECAGAAVVVPETEEHAVDDAVAENVVDHNGVPAGRDGVEDACKGQLHALKILSPSVCCLFFVSLNRDGTG